MIGIVTDRLKAEAKRIRDRLAAGFRQPRRTYYKLILTKISK